MSPQSPHLMTLCRLIRQSGFSTSHAAKFLFLSLLIEWTRALLSKPRREPTLQQLTPVDNQPQTELVRVFYFSSHWERERYFWAFCSGALTSNFFPSGGGGWCWCFLWGELKTLFIANLVIADQKSHFDPISIRCWWIVDTYSLLLLLNRWKMSLTTSSKSDMREKTFRICRDYLNGIWKMIKPQEMVLKQVRWVVNCLPFLFNLNLPFWTFL